jgi:protein-disulfide isomerase
MADEFDEPTRKQRRADARAQREEVARQQAAAAARRKRFIGLGAAVGVVVIALVVVIIVSSSGGSKNAGLNTHKHNSTEASVQTLLKGIPQDGAYLGKPTAPITMQYFGDLECPICKQFTLSTLPEMISDLVRTGKLRIQYRALETATQDPNVFKTQQVAALAAGRQNKMWQYVEIFYHEQGAEDTGYVDEKYLQGIAQQVPGLKLPAWEAARNQSALATSVTQDENASTSDQFSSTPSLLFTGPKGQQALVGAQPYSTILQAIQAVS